MKQNYVLRGITAAMLSSVLFTACSDDDSLPDTSTPTPDVETPHAYVIPASTTASGNTTHVLLTADQLAAGSVSTLNNGLVNDGASQWIF